MMLQKRRSVFIAVSLILSLIMAATHEGSGFGSSIQDIKKLCKGAEIKKGFSVYGSSVKTSDTKVKKLVKKI